MKETQFYCVKCGKKVTLTGKDVDSIKVKVAKNGVPMLTGYCSKCDTKVNKFIKMKDEDKLAKKYGKARGRK